MVGLEGTSRTMELQPPTTHRATNLPISDQPRLPRAPSNLALNTSRDGRGIHSLSGQLFQPLTTPLVEKLQTSACKAELTSPASFRAGCCFISLHWIFTRGHLIHLHAGLRTKNTCPDVEQCSVHPSCRSQPAQSSNRKLSTERIALFPGKETTQVLLHLSSARTAL